MGTGDRVQGGALDHFLALAAGTSKRICSAVRFSTSGS
jgi:hypothetical protein